jgi:hypothetical protein
MWQPRPRFSSDNTYIEANVRLGYAIVWRRRRVAGGAFKPRRRVLIAFGQKTCLTPRSLFLPFNGVMIEGN